MLIISRIHTSTIYNYFTVWPLHSCGCVSAFVYELIWIDLTMCSSKQLHSYLDTFHICKFNFGNTDLLCVCPFLEGIYIYLYISLYIYAYMLELSTNAWLCYTFLLAWKTKYSCTFYLNMACHYGNTIPFPL